MSNSLPQSLQEIVDELSHLPGLGPKSALRIAMALLKMPVPRTKQFGQNIFELRDKLHLCSLCESLTEVDPCPICSDNTREKQILCLVSDWDSLLSLEAVGFYKGQYLIIANALPSSPQAREMIDLDKLKQRLINEDIKEILLALGSTIEADNAANYIRSFIANNFPQIKISRLAQGMPIGAEVKYMDKETLKQSIKYRQEL